MTISTLQPLSCPPAMHLVNVQRQNKSVKYLLRGDSEGVVILWTVPEVTAEQLVLIRQKDKPKTHTLSPTIKTSLTSAWEVMKPSPVGILDQMDSGDGNAIKLTSSIYLPQQSRLVLGREDGSIIIVPATQTVMLQILHGNHQQYDGKLVLSWKKRWSSTWDPIWIRWILIADSVETFNFYSLKIWHLW